MKYKREKPNRRYWAKGSKKNRPPHLAPDPIQATIDGVAATLAPIVAQLKAIEGSLDEQCAIYGHLLSDRIERDRLICARCGRSAEEISSRHSASRS